MIPSFCELIGDLHTSPLTISTPGRCNWKVTVPGAVNVPYAETFAPLCHTPDWQLELTAEDSSVVVLANNRARCTSSPPSAASSVPTDFRESNRTSVCCHIVCRITGDGICTARRRSATIRFPHPGLANLSAYCCDRSYNIYIVIGISVSRRCYRHLYDIRAGNKGFYACRVGCRVRPWR